MGCWGLMSHDYIFVASTEENDAVDLSVGMLYYHHLQHEATRPPTGGWISNTDGTAPGPTIKYLHRLTPAEAEAAMKEHAMAEFNPNPAHPASHINRVLSVEMLEMCLLAAGPDEHVRVASVCHQWRCIIMAYRQRKRMIPLLEQAERDCMA